MAHETLTGTIPARGFSWSDVGFPARRVGDFAALNYGKGLVESKRTSGPYPVFGTNGPCGQHNAYLTKGPGMILGRKGQGHLGVKWCDSPFWVIDTAYYAEVDEEQSDLRWFYYITKYVGLDHLKSGEKPGLNRDIFGRQIVPFPPLAEQRAIARILGALDEKIELNKEMNRTLEATAQAIFRSWFVDFDPVAAKADGRKPFGMSGDLAALFPDRFVESELGPIPEGWRMGSIADLLRIETRSVQPQQNPAEVFDHLSIPAFDLGRRPVQEAGSLIKSNKYLVTPRSVLLSKLNPEISRVWLPGEESKNRLVCSTEFIVCVPRPPFHPAYLFCLFTNPEFRATLLGLVTGTSNSHQRVRPKDFRRIMALEPTEGLVLAFRDVVSPPLTETIRARSETHTLATLRDLLLPKLLSGEIRVAEAEERLEALRA